MTLLVLQLLLFLVCLVGSAFYAGIETGVISINRIRLRHHARAGVPAARILQDFLDKPDRLLGTTLLGNNLCNVMASISAASIAMHFSRTWGPTISAGIATTVLLIFGEYLPKSWFRAMPYVRCSRFAHILYVNWLIARPLVAIVTWVARFIAPGPRRAAGADAGFVSKDEIKMLAREGATGGALSSRERDMIHSVMEMSRTLARTVLVPRARMTIAPQDITVRDLRALSHKSGFTRIPLYDAATDRFTGVVNVFDLLPDTVDPDAPASDFARTALVLPETLPIDDMLPRLRSARQRLCLLRGADGKISGLATTEDILLEIVGRKA